MVCLNPAVPQGAHVSVPTQLRKAEASRPEAVGPVVGCLNTSSELLEKHSVRQLGFGDAVQWQYSAVPTLAPNVFGTHPDCCGRPSFFSSSLSRNSFLFREK